MFSRILRKLTGPLMAAALFLFLTEAGLRTAAFVHGRQKNRIHPAAAKTNGTGPLNILCLGESTTYRQYPVQLAQLLREEHPELNAMVIDEGVPAINTTRILRRLPELHARHNPDIAIIMAGVNDDDIDTDRAHYVRLYAGLRPGFEQKLARACKTYALARYTLWHLFFSHDSKRLETLSRERLIPAAQYPGYKLGTNVKFFYGGRDNIVTARAEKQIIEIRKTDLGTKTLARDFLTRTLAKDEMYPELFFEAMQKVFADFISADREKTKERKNDIAGLLESLPNTKLKLRFEVIFHDLISFDLRKASDAAHRLLALDPADPYAMSFCDKTAADMRAARCDHPFDFVKIVNSTVLPKQDYAAMEEIYRRAYRQFPHLRWVLGDIMATAYAFLKEKDKLEELAPYIPLHHFIVSGSTLGPAAYFPPVTISNYNAIVRFLLDRGTTVICMQYPMRRVDALKSIVEDRDRVFFVSNEEPFRAATREHGLTHCFIDLFGVDFGHCTETGNRMLAQNAARAVLKAVGAATDRN